MPMKMIIHTNRNSSTDLHLKQVRMVMRDLFLIEKYWSETNEKLPSFLSVWHPVYVISQFWIVTLQSHIFTAKILHATLNLLKTLFNSTFSVYPEGFLDQDVFFFVCLLLWE